MDTNQFILHDNMSQQHESDMSKKKLKCTIKPNAIELKAKLITESPPNLKTGWHLGPYGSNNPYASTLTKHTIFFQALVTYKGGKQQQQRLKKEAQYFFFFSFGLNIAQLQQISHKYLIHWFGFSDNV